MGTSSPRLGISVRFLLRGGLRNDRLGLGHVRRMRSVGPRIDPGELRAQQEDLGGVVNPDDQQHERTGGAKADATAGIGRDKSPRRNFPISNRTAVTAASDPLRRSRRFAARHEFVDHREQRRAHHQRNDDVDNVQHDLPITEDAAIPIAEDAQRSADHERYQHQEAQSEHQAEREESAFGADSTTPLVFFAAGTAPDAVQRAFATRQTRSSHPRSAVRSRRPKTRIPASGSDALLRSPCTAVAPSRPITPPS